MAELRLTLDDAYHWEKTMPDRVWMTQPVGDGKVETYTWAQAMDQVRRMAAHLQSLGLEPGTQIGDLEKLRALHLGRPRHLDGGTCERSALPDPER